MASKNPDIKTIADLIAAFGTGADFARACGYTSNPQARANDIKTREFLPVERWPAIIEAAKLLKIRGITPELLMEICNVRIEDVPKTLVSQD